jgi:hypothetical protein
MIRGSQVRFQSTKNTVSIHLSPKRFLFLQYRRNPPEQNLFDTAGINSISG